MNEVLDFLQANPTYFLATMDGAQPRVRPFGAVMGYEDRLYMITSNEKDCYKQMQANPKVEICGIDPTAANWLRVSATVVFDTSIEAKQAMLDTNPNLKNLYSIDDGIMEVFYLKDATASFCSFTAEPRTIRF